MGGKLPAPRGCALEKRPCVPLDAESLLSVEGSKALLGSHCTQVSSGGRLSWAPSCFPSGGLNHVLPWAEGRRSRAGFLSKSSLPNCFSGRKVVSLAPKCHSLRCLCTQPMFLLPGLPVTHLGKGHPVSPQEYTPPPAGENGTWTRRGKLKQPSHLSFRPSALPPSVRLHFHPSICPFSFVLSSTFGPSLSSCPPYFCFPSPFHFCIRLHPSVLLSSLSTSFLHPSIPILLPVLLPSFCLNFPPPLPPIHPGPPTEVRGWEESLTPPFPHMPDGPLHVPGACCGLSDGDVHCCSHVLKLSWCGVETSVRCPQAGNSLAWRTALC